MMPSAAAGADESVDTKEQTSSDDLSELIRDFVLEAGSFDASDSKDVKKADADAFVIDKEIAALSESEKEGLSNTLEAYSNAVESVAVMEEEQGVGELSDKLPDEVLENSFRYNNGQLITDAIEDIERETKEASNGNNSTLFDSSNVLLMSTKSAMSVSKASGSYKSAYPSYSGVDFSKWQGTVDFSTGLSSGVEDTDGNVRSLNFAILRCGYTSGSSSSGYTYNIDPQFSNYVNQCVALGIPFGVYYYSKATSESMVKKEVEVVKKAISGYTLSLPVYLDMEDSSVISSLNKSDSKISAIASSFVSQMSGTGYLSGIYASTAYWYDYLDTFASTDTSSYHWVAQYADYCAYGDSVAAAAYKNGIYTYKDYHRYETWQLTSSGKASWQNGSLTVDLDYWYGSFPCDAS